jgi:hypothetical protein
MKGKEGRKRENVNNPLIKKKAKKQQKTPI